MSIRRDRVVDPAGIAMNRQLADESPSIDALELLFRFAALLVGVWACESATL